MPAQDTLEEAHQLSQKEAFKLLDLYFEQGAFFYLFKTGEEVVLYIVQTSMVENLQGDLGCC